MESHELGPLLLHMMSLVQWAWLCIVRKLGFSFCTISHVLSHYFNMTSVLAYLTIAPHFYNVAELCGQPCG